MNNTVETIGLRVLSVSPNHKASSVNVNTDIKIEFNSDVNPATFEKNFVILEDANGTYKGIGSLNDYSKYGVVKGSATYADKVLTFTPSEPFKTGICYVVMLNDGVKDITGNHLVKKHVSCFYTEKIASYSKCTITSPKYGLITSSVPTFTWPNLGSPSYTFQISKMNTFEILTCDETIVGNQVDEEISYVPERKCFPLEGAYFIRVKAENADWSDFCQIFIKPITDAVIAEEDTPEIQSLDDFLEGLEEPLVILEKFPEPDSIGNSIKTNIVYLKVQGKLDESALRLDDCWVYGETADDTHEEFVHGELVGSWSVVYDSYYDVTYIIFTPNAINEVIEEDESEPEPEPGDDNQQDEEPTETDDNNNTEDEG